MFLIDNKVCHSHIVIYVKWLEINQEGTIDRIYFKFRDELNISEQEALGKKVYVIQDKLTGKFYRLKEMEYYIARQLDGSTGCDEIASRFTEKFDSKVSSQTIEKFVNQLYASGMLIKPGQEEIPKVRQKKRSLFGKLLFVKIKALNPEHFVERTFSFARLFYTRSAFMIYILMTLLSAGITIANYGDMKFQLYSFFRPEIIPLAWITIFFVTVIHEFSHTYSCRIHGGKVRDMGFLLLYFQPCFYTNVSEAYMFPERKKRIAVTVAGIISQIVIWAAATLIWRLTSMDNIFNTVAFIIIALSFVGITFNLNPLLKLDGYYFLVDYWEITNLRQKAFSYLRQQIIGLDKDENRQEVNARERKIFIWYGIAAIIYSGSILHYIAIKAGKFLYAHLGSFGVVLLIAFILYLFLDAMRKGRVFSIAYNQRGAILKPSRLIIFSIILVAVIAALIFIHLPLRITNDCEVKPSEQISLRSTSTGYAELIIERANEERVLKQYQLVGQDYGVLSILPALKVGDTVTPGDLIAGIESNVYESEKQERYANLESSRKQLDLLEKGPQLEEINQTEDIINQVKSKYEQSVLDLNRAESLYAKGGISKQQLEDEKTNNQVLKSELDLYQNQLILLKRGARPEEIDMARAEVDQLEAKLKHLESQLEQTTIASPIAGIVTQVNKDNLIISISRIDTVKVQISVPEKEISVVAVGNEVKMKARSYPGITYTGVVKKIEPIALTDERGRSIITVSAMVANPEGLLKSGMTGKAKINCGSWPLYKLILWRVVRYLRVEFWSWW